jgi:hypothetical protein
MRFLSMKIALAALTAAAVTVPAAASAATHGGGSIASLGDSITRAFDTCLPLLNDCPGNSWSTGTNPGVDSWYQRLVAGDDSVSGHDYNDARTGAKMVDLAGQAALAVSQQARVITVLMGGNDVCTSNVATMTDPTTLGDELRAALLTITSGDPRARIYVASIPNVYRLWELLHTNLVADFVWSIAGICQSLLANPLSTAPADVARRLQVQSQTVADNAEISEVCASFARACHYDGGAVYDVQFTSSDVDTVDYYHPSISGQAKLAAGTWAAFFGPGHGH